MISVNFKLIQTEIGATGTRPHHHSVFFTPVSLLQRSSWGDASARIPWAGGWLSDQLTTKALWSSYSRLFDESVPRETSGSSALWWSGPPGRGAAAPWAAAPSTSPSEPHCRSQRHARPLGCPGELSTGFHWTTWMSWSRGKSHVLPVNATWNWSGHLNCKLSTGSSCHLGLGSQHAFQYQDLKA